MYWTPGSGREDGCSGAVTSTTWPLGPVPAKTRLSGRAARERACVSSASKATVQDASSFPSRRKTWPESPVAAKIAPWFVRARSQTLVASILLVGSIACASRATPLSEMTTPSRFPFENAAEVSCRQLSSFANAESRTPSASRKMEAIRGAVSLIVRRIDDVYNEERLVT